MKNNIFDSFLPLSARYFFILGSIVLTFFIIFVLQSIVLPLLAALIVSILLKPICLFLEKLKIPRIFSTIITTLIMLMILGGGSYFIVMQIKDIQTDINGITESLNAAIDKIKNWISIKSSGTQIEPEKYLKDASNTMIKNSVSFAQSTISNTFEFISRFFLFLIGVFFFLYYRNFLKIFLFKVFKDKYHAHLNNILQTTQKIIRKYLIGFLTVLVIVAILNTIGLLLLGLKHAVFFGILGSILLIIPYIGITIGAIIPCLFALATTGSLWKPLAVLLVFWFVQFLEGNFITPYIVGRKVSINAFTILVTLFFSGLFFGLLGLILTIPTLAILKILFDEIEFLQAFGFLLGSPDKNLIKSSHSKL